MQIPISDEKYVFAMCFMVTASTNGKDEEVFVSDVATAAEQGEIFKRAGHEYFGVHEVSVLTGVTMEAGTWYLFEKDYVRPITVHHKVIPAKYSRADIYRGVKVRTYDRDVLKRRTTGIEAIFYCVIAAALAIAPIGISAVIAGEIVKHLHWKIGVILLSTLFYLNMMIAPKWVKFCGKVGRKFASIPLE